MQTKDSIRDYKMYSMIDTALSEFVLKQMEQRGWTQAELARRMGVSRTAVSNVLSGMRGAGADFCLALSQALHLPPEDVFRMAGILPPQNVDRVERLAERIASLDEEDQELLDAFIDRMLSRKGKRASLPHRASESPAGAD